MLETSAEAGAVNADAGDNFDGKTVLNTPPEANHLILGAVAGASTNDCCAFEDDGHFVNGDVDGESGRLWADVGIEDGQVTARLRWRVPERTPNDWIGLFAGGKFIKVL